MLKMGRSRDRLIFNMIIQTAEDGFYIEAEPRKAVWTTYPFGPYGSGAISLIKGLQT